MWDRYRRSWFDNINFTRLQSLPCEAIHFSTCTTPPSFKEGSWSSWSRILWFIVQTHLFSIVLLVAINPTLCIVCQQISQPASCSLNEQVDVHLRLCAPRACLPQSYQRKHKAGTHALSCSSIKLLSQPKINERNRKGSCFANSFVQHLQSFQPCSPLMLRCASPFGDSSSWGSKWRQTANEVHG